MKDTEIINIQRRVSIINRLRILLILILNRVGDKILPCGPPCSCSEVSDNAEPIRTLKEIRYKIR